MEKRRKRLRELIGLKIFAAIIAAVCVFVCFMSAVLTVICLKNDVYFDDDHSAFLENVTERITDGMSQSFVLRFDDYLHRVTDDGKLDPSLFEASMQQFLPENCNYIFLVTDHDGNNIYCTANYSGADNDSIAGYSRFSNDWYVELHVLTNEYTDFEEYYYNLAEWENEFGNSIDLYSFTGTVYGFMRQNGSVVAQVPVALIDENGEITYTEYTDRFEENYRNYLDSLDLWQYEQEDYESGAAAIADTVQPTLVSTTFIGDSEPIIYVTGKRLADKYVTVNISTYVSDDPQIIDEMYFGMHMVELISLNAEAYPILFVVSGLILLICLIYLVCTAGYRYPNDAPAPSWFDKLPYEAFIFAAIFGVWMIAEVYYEITYSHRYYFLTLVDIRLLEIAIYIAVPILFGIFAVLVLMTTAVRLKTGTFWRSTFVGFVCRMILKALKFIGYLIGCIKLTWKVIVLLAAYGLYNILAMMAAYESYGGFGLYFLLFLFGTAALAAVLLIWAAGFTKIRDYAKQVANGELGGRINRDYLFGDLRRTADDLEGVGEGVRIAVDERMRSERLKTELITNVSHDLKTPLTSIVNYVDILSKDEIESESAREHIDILKRQAARMKKLIEDLVEVSKATSGNVAVSLERTDVNLLLTQTETEYAARFEECKLEPIIKIPENKMIANLDGRLMWRVLDNLCNNICKYALAHTRVYITAEESEQRINISFKNISRFPLDISGEDLTERFVRGDSSRNTEGSGLGLSIAKNLCDLQGVGFNISIDGDLFKAELAIAKIGDEEIIEDSLDEQAYGQSPAEGLREARAQVILPGESYNDITQTGSSTGAEEVPPEGETPECPQSTDMD